MTSAEQALESLSLEQRSDGVAVVRFDLPGEAVNTLQASFAVEFTAMLERLARIEGLKAVVFISGKPDAFIAGADIRMLRDVERADEATQLSLRGQVALAALAAFHVPVVAAIHGACLGGGLELALACSARVASADPKTKLGLPEVQLGLLPGLGGTQRLPRLVGVQAALDLLLTGKQLDGKRALRLGLIDELVPASILLDVALRLALSRASAPRLQKRSRGRWFGKAQLTEFALAENPLGRKLVFDQAKKRVLAKSHGNYPAPERILEIVKLGLAEGLERGLAAEAKAFGELVVGEQARALMHVFFASTEAKKDTGVEEAAGAEPRAVHRIAVLGAGLMGAGVAYVSVAQAKVDVRLKDRDEPSLGKGLKYVRSILDERVKSRRLDVTARDLIMAQLTATTDYAGFDAVDLVIEAVFEDLNVKRQVLAECEQSAGKSTIFASNTSSLPIARIADGARRPEQVIGMHYFSPVHKMPLLEVVVTGATLPWVTATCVAFGKRQGKTVIVVNDGAGFYTSRILGPYLSEASYLLAEGVAIERIDEALVSWGFPVGPLTLLDEIGIDVGDKVGHVLAEAFGTRMAPPPGIDGLLKDHRLGKKNQRGFYAYAEGEQAKGAKLVDRSVYAVLGVEPNRELPLLEIAQRCALRMINEALHCFGDGILRSARDGDIGAIFGLGFPPFLGGPFHYADSVGVAELVRRLESYRDQLGPRFAPAPVLVELAKSGGTFHGPSAVAPGQHRG
jgi:3-hydroxyacyl-CoA dehydrogenase/enoyl-CoA hydratase/3-hydroxybutyryl-CoA epimerase